MGFRIKSFLLVVLLLIPLSSGLVEGFKGGIHPTHLLYKDGLTMNSRKLLGLDAVLDYDDPEASSKHGQNQKKRSGRNP
ncbi:putative Adenosylcobalamin-dependent ribonucleoside-triphosphate reductase [Quillaja saponaria]|uniref:Adenosylcobalamin-dependent ribonucleoside-triphosphate reductase n=1 Tax=Quillaja saponaria TaxID=32244 RepID=A0AAD7LVV7_QUISA|nr:putative Adenosylcobalamin-dependent ribonucleoside-triphosphate reductase [Quillaja saponaria]